VQDLKPWEAALLAGIIQSPSFYNPVTHPGAARARRNLVLAQMLQQGYLTSTEYDESVGQSLPAPKDIQPPHETLAEGVDAGYFVGWVTQQLIERYEPTRVFDGGLRVKTTLDLDLQSAAEQAVGAYLPGPGGPTAALVAIENSTGDVRAMVGGRNFRASPFNLATEGERQPGSSFKAFDLAAALQDGISPESVWSSHLKIFNVPSTHVEEHFVVHNDEGAYTGSNTLTGATAYSDNSIYAEVGLKVGTERIARLARQMGITTPISTNPAMTIGGLSVGVTPLDMAHAYETIAHGGERVSGSLASDYQPVGIQEVDAGGRTLPDGHHQDRNGVLTKRVLPPGVAATETSMLQTVLQYGTAKAAAIGQFAAGKTGTTSNFGDAWFVGWNSKYTVAVWVGYPDKLVPMTTDFNGQPVFGGTFPALIWHDFMLAAMHVEQSRAARSGSTSTKGAKTSGAGSLGQPEAPSGETTSTAAPSGGKPASGAGEIHEAQKGAPTTHSGGGESSGGSSGKEQAPATAPTPATPPPATQAPRPPAEASPTSKSGAGGGATGGVSPSG
jgi:penicillin-binding protein 1A